jgi:hypothetical protein
VGYTEQISAIDIATARTNRPTTGQPMEMTTGPPASMAR